MTIYEFILKHSAYGEELFTSKEIIYRLRRMTDDDKLEFLKDYDKKRKPKTKRKRTTKVDKTKETLYNSKQKGGKNETKSVPRKKRRKATSKGASK